MKVIAEIEYEVDDTSSIIQAKKAIKDTPHGSTFSTAENESAEFIRVINVKKKVAK